MDAVLAFGFCGCIRKFHANWHADLHKVAFHK